METIIRRIFVACFIAIMCVSSIEAQVIDLSEKQINDDQTIGKEEEEKRETHLNHVLPEVVLYTSNGTINNFIANALGAIAAYCFFEKKPAIDVEFINDGQLSLF